MCELLYMCDLFDIKEMLKAWAEDAEKCYGTEGIRGELSACTLPKFASSVLTY